MLDEAAGERVTAVACDTRPFAERAIAARAGLGWIGKHTNLISPQLGSFVFLGEVVTTLTLPPDAALRKNCGSCTRCVDVCPTRALRGDYTIDATRCIADLTQRTDGIPRDLRPLIGDWVWGCDLCHLACPPTQAAGDRGDPRCDAPLEDETARPSLTALLRVRSGEFKRRFARTAMGWRGAAVLRRNAAVALGNALDRSAVSALALALREDSHPMVRGHAAWALGRIGAPSALTALRQRYSIEKDGGVLEEIGAALNPSSRETHETTHRRDRGLRSERRRTARRRLHGSARPHGGDQSRTALVYGDDERKRRAQDVSVPDRGNWSEPTITENPTRTKSSSPAAFPRLPSSSTNCTSHVEPPSRWRVVYQVTVLSDDGTDHDLPARPTRKRATSSTSTRAPTTRIRQRRRGIRHGTTTTAVTPR